MRVPKRGCQSDPEYFRYLDKDARDIMTHRKNIVAIDGEESLEDAFKFMLGKVSPDFPSIMRILMRSSVFSILGRRLPVIYRKSCARFLWSN